MAHGKIRSFWSRVSVCFVAVLLMSCGGIPIDPSMDAVAAGDFTLGVSACNAVPGSGMDACHVREGTKIDSAWVLIVPAGFEGMTGGEVDVYYRDIQKTYPVNNKVIRIPWADFFQNSVWRSEFDGEALALVSINYKDNDGIDKVQKFRGIAKIIVTKAGYDRLPIDSGYAAWKTTCKIQYSSAGRGAVSCQ